MQTRKVLALLLALVMLLGLMSGCGSNSNETTTSEVAPVAEAPAEDASAQEEEGGLSTGGLVLPLVEETVTLTEWWGGFDADQIGIADPSEVLVSKAAEERTGVHVDYVVCGSSAAQEAGSIMYASSEYCDMIAGGIVTYTGGFVKGVEDGVYIELNDLIDGGYAPNYKAILQSDATVAKDAATDSGLYIAFWQISDNAQWPWYGTMIRADWLEKVNMDVPTTYDQLHDVLVAFQDQLGVEHPMEPGENGYGWFDNFLAGCNVTSSWMQVDGKVQYSPVQDGYRQYLEIMSSWYAEGLINPDFMSITSADESTIMGEKAGVFCSGYVNCDTFSNGIEGAHVIGMPEPVLNEGDVRHVGQVNGRVSSKWVAISASCENPELAAQWIDYFYSEEGAMLNNYGIEGETYTLDENGKPQFTDMIANNPDGLSFKNSCWRFIDGGPGVRLYVWERELAAVSQDCLDCEAAWSHDGAYMISDLTTPTAEESEAQNAVMGDVETYVNEMTQKFITGQESLDNWDTYCDYIWGLGLQDAIDIEQDVLDRYNAR